MEVLNDLDNDIHNTFRVIRNSKRCEALKHLLLCTPDGREQFEQCKAMLDDHDPVRRAWAFLVLANIADIRRSVRERTWFNWKHRLYWLPEDLSWWCDRLLRVKLECRAWQDMLRHYDRDDGMLYLDPPYHPDTLNTNENLYRYVMTAQEHVELLTQLRQCRSRVMVCGYPHPLYNKILSGWVELQMSTTCRIGDRHPRKETVWLNYYPASGGRIHA
jgi:DNA adenine methylase